jgi:hypothetical protein
MKEHLHILQHSLGLDEYGQGRQYRNHFVTGPGSKDWDACRALTDAGLMTENKGHALLPVGDSVFYVTPAGIDFVATNSPKPPKVSRNRRRYAAFMDLTDCCPDLTFKQFLTDPNFADARRRA